MDVIVFKTEGGGVAVMYPAPEFADQAETIAERDVPSGAQWRIVSSLPDAPQERWRWTDDGPLALAPPNDPRTAWRQTAYLAKGSFVRALRAEGILPSDEAVAAAKGEWPATFASALSTLPVDPVDAQIDWSAAVGVARLNPLFLALLGYYAKAHGLSRDAAQGLGDQIFGMPDDLISAD